MQLTSFTPQSTAVESGIKTTVRAIEQWKVRDGIEAFWHCPINEKDEGETHLFWSENETRLWTIVLGVHPRDLDEANLEYIFEVEKEVDPLRPDRCFSGLFYMTDKGLRYNPNA